ncbi:MAG: hypothetical protein QOF14_4937 [Hyphomicrobiales bacterium]|jgi:uncharacterized protein YjbI with pentapeptide repeats|nr:hypothetical protein [Hyphomicrobiales bacterium]
MADSKIDPFDVGALERAVNDSATRVSAIWLSFVAFSAYLAAAASNISHRQLFLEDPIKLPTINIDLPLVASAILLPLLFVIYHVYVLLQVVLLARTAAAYNEAIERAAPDTTDSTRVRQRLGNTLFAQLFAGSPREREGVLGWLLRAMTWITLAIAPVFVLILFEIRFLPYHGALVTWTHRALITIDLLAILLLWAGAVDVRRNIALRSLMHDWKTALGAAVIVLLACTLVTFPGELGRFWVGAFAESNASEGEVAECRIPWIFSAAGTGYDRLVLRGEDVVDDEKLKRIVEVAKANGQPAYASERTRVFRGRDLRCGRFSGSDLRHVDFSQSDLTGAILRGARLEGTTFSGARLNGAILDGAQLQEAFFGTSGNLAEARVGKPKSEDEDPPDSIRQAGADRPEVELGPAELSGIYLRGAQLQGAHLKGVTLDDANLTGARLEGALLESASMRRAKLPRAVLAGARLDSAILHGAVLQSANLDGASLDNAHLQGSRLTMASLRGASLRHTEMQGLKLFRTDLEGAVLYRTQLQGALFDRTLLKAATFVEAQLQGTRSDNAQSQQAMFWRSYHGNSRNVTCTPGRVFAPNNDAIVEMVWDAQIGNTRERGPKPVPANQESIADFAKRTYAGMPDSEQLQKELAAALSQARDEQGVERLHRCANPVLGSADAHMGLTADLLRLVCQRRPTTKYAALGIYQNWIDNHGALGSPHAEIAVALTTELRKMLEDKDGLRCAGLEHYDLKMRARVFEVSYEKPN